MLLHMFSETHRDFHNESNSTTTGSRPARARRRHSKGARLVGAHAVAAQLCDHCCQMTNVVEQQQQQLTVAAAVTATHAAAPIASYNRNYSSSSIIDASDNTKNNPKPLPHDDDRCDNNIYNFNTSNRITRVRRRTGTIMFSKKGKCDQSISNQVIAISSLFFMFQLVINLSGLLVASSTAPTSEAMMLIDDQYQRHQATSSQPQVPNNSNNNNNNSKNVMMRANLTSSSPSSSASQMIMAPAKNQIKIASHQQQPQYSALTSNTVNSNPGQQHTPVTPFSQATPEFLLNLVKTSYSGSSSTSSSSSASRSSSSSSNTNSNQQQTSNTYNNSNNSNNNNNTNTLNANNRLAQFNKLWPGQQQRDHVQYKTVYACEGNKLELSCASEGKLIHLVRATYGRFSLSMCNEHGHSNLSVQCGQFRAFLIMQPICNGLSNCSIMASEEVFGDPCEGTSKYLEVQYACEDQQQQHQHANASQQPPAQRPRTPNEPAAASNELSSHIAPQVKPASPRAECQAQVSSRGLSWSPTRAGQVARQACPEGATGQATWLCDARKLRFVAAPDFSQCNTNWLGRISQQLDQALISTRSTTMGQQVSLSGLLDVLNEMRLLAQARQLFAEDLRRISVMLGQIMGELKPLVSNQQQQVPFESRADQLERLMQLTMGLVSGLFEPTQKLAWLELTSASEIRSLEAQLLGQLRLSGALLISVSLPAATQTPSDALLSWQDKNILARMVQVQQPAATSVISSSNEQFLKIISTQQQQSHNVKQSELAELKVHSSILRQLGADATSDPLINPLASNVAGLISRVLVLDVRKLDFGQLKQLESNTTTTSQQAMDHQTAAAAAGDQTAPSALAEQPQQHIIGVFPVVGSPGDQFVAAGNYFEQRVLQQMLSQWPVSVQFKTPAAAASEYHCSSRLDFARDTPSLGNHERCQTIRPAPHHLAAIDGTTTVCRCEQLGFVSLSSSPATSSLLESQSTTLINGQQQFGNSNDDLDQSSAPVINDLQQQTFRVGGGGATQWPTAPSNGNRFSMGGEVTDNSIDTSMTHPYVFGPANRHQHASPDASNIVQHQQHQRTIQSWGSAIALAIGVILLLVALIGMSLGLSRVSFQSRLLASKQATYLGSGSTTDPQLEHSLVNGCCPIITQQQPASGGNLMSPSSHQGQSPYQFHYTTGGHLSSLVNNNKDNTSTSAISVNDATSRPFQQHASSLSYGPANGTSSTGGFGFGRRARSSASRFLPEWLLKPGHWFRFNQLQHQSAQLNHNHYDQHVSSHHNIIHQTLPSQMQQQLLNHHQQRNLINVVASNQQHQYQHQHQPNQQQLQYATKSHFQNGYTTNLHHHQHGQQQQQLINTVGITGGASSNSTSSYVSSSAYYEEIGHPGSGSSLIPANGTHSTGASSKILLGGASSGSGATISSSSTSQLIPSHSTHQRTIVDPFKGPNNIIISNHLNNNNHNNNNYL